MSALLVGAVVLFALLAIVMTIVAARLIRENRARSAARVEALRAMMAAPSPVAEPPAPHRELVREMPDDLPPLPSVTVLDDDVWDFDLHEPEPEELRAAPIARRAPLELDRSRLMPAHTPRVDFEPSAPSAVQEHALFEDPVERTPSRRLGWMVAAGVAMASVAGVIYLLSSGVLMRPGAPAGPSQAAIAASPIELLSLRHASDAGQFVVTGLVQNPAASIEHRGVFAVVYLFDHEGKYFATSRAALESAVLSPGGEAAFVVRVPASGDVSKYRVSFQREDGGAVMHVDRRGTLPEHTSGDAVATPQPPIVNARKSS